MIGTQLYNKDKLAINPISHASVINSDANPSYTTVEDSLKELWNNLNSNSSTSYVVCSTSSNVADKSIEVEDFILNDRVRLLINMINNNTADNVNLAIESLTPRPLYYNGKRVNSSNTWKSNAILDVYYDGTNFQSSDFNISNEVSELSNKAITKDSLLQDTGLNIDNTMSLKAITDALSLNIKDVTQDGSDGISYERVKNLWVARSYYIDGNLGLLTSETLSDLLQDILGDCDLFIKAVDLGLDIYSIEYTNSSDIKYSTRIPINYQKQLDISTLNLTWQIGTIFTNIFVDASDGWGDISKFVQIDISKTNINIALELGEDSLKVVSLKVITDEFNKKLNLLNSGINIKTINGNSIVGPGNLLLNNNSGKAIILKIGTETNYQVSTTTASGGTLYYNKTNKKIYYRVDEKNFTDWNVENFYDRNSVCNSDGTPITGVFYLIEDTLYIFSGENMNSTYNGPNIHYLRGITSVNGESPTTSVKYALNDVIKFCESVENSNTIFIDQVEHYIVPLKGYLSGLSDEGKFLRLDIITPEGIYINANITVNILTGEVVSVLNWDKSNFAISTESSILNYDSDIWDITTIIENLLNSKDISSNSYTHPLSIAKPLFGSYTLNAKNSSIFPLNIYKEYSELENVYKLWISFMQKDSYYRFGIDLGQDANTWGDIKVSDFKKTIIGG